MPSRHAEKMARLYRTQAAVFDVTRRPVLLGRPLLAPQVRPGDRILEVGCGTGHNLAPLAAAAGRRGRVVGIECAPAMAERARRRAGTGVRVIQAEYADGPGPGLPPLDAIVFSYSLSMIPHYPRVLARAHRDLRPGGRLLVLDFTGSRWAAVRALMGRFGVELGGDRVRAAHRGFRRIRFDRFRAWGGLWDYHLLVAERRDDSGPATC